MSMILCALKIQINFQIKYRVQTNQNQMKNINSRQWMTLSCYNWMASWALMWRRELSESCVLILSCHVLCGDSFFSLLWCHAFHLQIAFQVSSTHCHSCYFLPLCWGRFPCVKEGYNIGIKHKIKKIFPRTHEVLWLLLRTLGFQRLHSEKYTGVVLEVGVQ
jgi:hypothetical protein